MSKHLPALLQDTLFKKHNKNASARKLSKLSNIGANSYNQQELK